METGLVSIEVVSKIHAVAVDIQAIKRNYFVEEELKPEEILRILKDNGMRARLKHLTKIDDLIKYPAPFIILSKENAYHVFLGKKEDRIMIFNCAEKKMTELTVEDFMALWGGGLIALYPRFTKTEFFLNMKWLFKEFFKHRSVFSSVISASFFIQMFGLVSPLFIQVIIDKVLAHHALTTLEVVAGAFMAVLIFDAVLNLMRNYLLYHTANKIDASLGAKVYRHLLSLPFRYFEVRKVGNIIARVRELENLRQFMTNISLTVLLDTVFSVVFIVIMAVYSARLTFIVLGFILAIGLISFFATPLINVRLNDKFQKGAVSQSFLVESITGIQTVKSLAIEGKMVKDWEKHLGEYILSAFKLSNLGNVAVTSSQTLQKMMTLAVIYFGVSEVFDGSMSVGQLIAFQMFSSQLSGPILRLVHMWQDFQQARLSLDRLGDIINTPPEVVGGALTVEKVQGGIVSKGVKFRYTAEGPLVLDRVDFEISPGMMVGIVGRSGSGKSTIAKLIQRLYLPVEGSIFVDGVDIRHLDPLFLRYKTGVVLQECFLFSGTIRDNIAMGAPDASMERIIQASRIAGAHEFISEMPMGYDTPVEERGSSLSGGQKQRIAIARALITNPNVLIFDEATSALDYESERMIQNNLGLIRKGRTVIFIAHRMSVMKNCDQVLVIDKGKIVEEGNHESLMQKGGLYAYLYQQQEENRL
ncbi:MAG TPA: type I secretion system permease/ATPase [Syntrophales bacterium]|nr:type I secretion system permease/ATPase [Syntrophales bacterium]HPX56540.1 type I secretion system permease/ATPase [Syntrophales bacterium]HQA82772.1 type I secretion system permease/ATPase [Syntrophales bacterium]